LGTCVARPIAGWWPRRRRPAVGQRLVGAEDPEVALVLVELDDVAQERARARPCRRPSPRPARARRPRSRGSRACAGRAAAGRRWRADWRPCAASPLGASSASSGIQRPVLVEQLLRPVALHPALELREVLGVLAGSRAAPGASGTCLRPAGRRPPSGRSSPWASAARSSASAGAWRRRRARVVLDGRGSARRPSSVRPSPVHQLGLVALDEVRRPAVAAQNCSSSSC
jgi:hypothetical protein